MSQPNFQAITIAIGKKGIEFFTEKLIAGSGVNKLAGLKPSNKNLLIPDFRIEGLASTQIYSKFNVKLTEGSLSNFLPFYLNVEQLTSGQPAGSNFKLILASQAFSANFQWHETYDRQTCTTAGCSFSQGDSTYSYSPSFGSLTVDLTLQFTYDNINNAYSINVKSATGTSSNVSANIPGKSALQGQTSDGCFKTKVDDATASSIANIDFSTPINSILSGVLKSIPASGDIGNGISFDFALGKDGLAFPNSDGIQIAATGVASYKGKSYDGTNPPTLPIPAVPADTDKNHLNVYVSDWAVNGLNWAYYSAGRLNVSLEPSDIPNPDVLKTETYHGKIPSFQQYGNAAMNATITPQAAPITEFQTVYLFTTAVMDKLKQNLPSDVYQKLGAFRGNGYICKAKLESSLTQTQIASTYFQTIEDATKQKGMVTTQKMHFELQIENGAQPQPNLVFDVDRIDLMTNLALGIAPNSKAQTMKFMFRKVSSSVTFKSTTIPGFDNKDFGDYVWPIVGETEYATAMEKLGETGVAIPIAQGFRFLFNSATLNIEEGFVSISSQVEFKSEWLADEIKSLHIPLPSIV